MLIAFEGMDGVGKSTISSKVANNLTMRHETQKIMDVLNVNPRDYNKFVKDVRNSNNSRLPIIFYTFRCMYDKSTKEDVIVERSMVSVYYFEHEKVSEEEFSYLMSLDTIPDLTFILYGSSELRKERIRKRNPNDEDLNSTEALTDGYPLMLECVKKYKMPYIGINTEKYTEDQVIFICSEIIKNYKSLKDDEKEEFREKMNDKYGFEKIYEKDEKKLVMKGGFNYRCLPSTT